MSDKPITKENLDFCLKELAKEYRKRSGKSVPAEIVLIGGAAVLINYGFREMTYDMDAILEATSSMKDAIRSVGDRLDLPNGWINDDFIRTESYSPRIVGCSTYYRTYSNIVTVRTVTGAHLVAMKLKSGRQYKYDRSDVIGILWEQKRRGEPLSLEQIREAVEDLYGSYDALSDEIRQFIEKALEDGRYEEIYTRVRQAESENQENLLAYQEEKPGVMNTDNVNEVIAALRRRKEENQG